MPNYLGAACPKCGRDDKIQIEVRLWVDLHEDDFAIVEESYHSIRKPAGEDGAVCLACTWSGSIDELGWPAPIEWSGSQS